MYWMMGGFGGVDWQQLWLMIALLPVPAGSGLQSQPLEFTGAGRSLRSSAWLPLWLWRKLLVVATGWMVGVSGRCGGDWLIGLVIPHILRLCGLSDHRVLLPACMLAGASALLGAVSLPGWRFPPQSCRLAWCDGDPGAPVFIWLLLQFAGAGIARRRRQGRRRFRLYQPLIASPL
ncbi:iron chelate uptake ABC transporter family permease subunit [Klebsiella pneumoniae subsp. pneumoniae]|nr:iron chelate uptake ABC transporter family permease subunit [Klebsiella pneumoniae subsp. pneumoniae]